MPAIAMVDVRRTFRGRRGGEEVTALAGLDLEVERGAIHGILGPNGAGKTTTVKVLTTLLIPTSGEARVDGLDVVREVREVRKRIGLLLGGERGLHDRLSARENLRYAGVLYGFDRRTAQSKADDLLERVGLGRVRDERVEGFSRGMKQRVHLARSLVGDPVVLFLDEPTTGLDPVAALEFRRLVQELAAEDRTILLTTHDMAEAEEVCDRVTLIADGRVLATESPASLGQLISRYGRIDAELPRADLRDRLGRLPAVRSIEDLPDGRVRIEPTNESATNEVLLLLAQEGVTSVATSRPSLAEVYLHHFGDRGMAV